MAIPTARTTEVEAVSRILVKAGLAPVSVINNLNSQRASTLLQEQWRDVLAEGWWFNRRAGFELTPATDKTVTIPGDVLDLDDTQNTDDLIIVDGKLFSKIDNSNEFNTSTIAVNVILALDFESTSVPIVAQTYTVALATGEFLRGPMSDPARAKTFRDDINVARIALKAADMRNADFNLLDNRGLRMHRRLPRVGLNHGTF